jgi:4-hydroxythreonine-4-phosphate dehydrogenase
MLDIATDECLSGNFNAVITAPIQKSVINDAGIAFSGHTEYFAERCNNAYPVMLLACPELRVALVTTHLALRDIPDAITADKVEKTIRIVMEEMSRHFGIKKPAITVCGLNPHAGENGHLGTEEITIINPVIKQFVDNGYEVTGSLPADTAFRLEQRQKTDVFICMYHDQGLPVLKTLGFGEAVNITLGLPIIRTSVDHGTALELAGSGKAQSDSLLAAIDMADKMARHQLNSQISVV